MHAKKRGRHPKAPREGAGSKRGRKDHVRSQPRRDTDREVAEEQELSSVAQLIAALRAEGIRFQVVGMSAAILQGVPGTTQDLDLWIDLPARQYIRVLNIARRLNAQINANTVVTLPGDVLVNFLYEVHGLRSFAAEFKKAKALQLSGIKLPVLPLARVIRSKEFVGRDKDLLQLPALKRTLALQKKNF